MFIVGVIAGGVIAGAIAHDDHSRYSEYSKYSDAEIVANIEAQKRQRQYKYEELESIKKNLLSKYAEEISVLEDEPVLADKINIIKRKDKIDNIDNIYSIRSELLTQVKNKLEKELNNDRKQLVEIDTALARINEIQLTNKK